MVNKGPGEEVLHAMLHSCFSFLNVDDYHKWRMVIGQYTDQLVRRDTLEGEAEN